MSSYPPVDAAERGPRGHRRVLCGRLGPSAGRRSCTRSGRTPSPSAPSPGEGAGARAGSCAHLDVRTRLPITDDGFDLVVTTFSLHQWEDIPTAVGDLGRVLRPDAQLYVYDFGRASFTVLHGRQRHRRVLRAGGHHITIRTGSPRERAGVHPLNLATEGLPAARSGSCQAGRYQQGRPLDGDCSKMPKICRPVPRRSGWPSHRSLPERGTPLAGWPPPPGDDLARAGTAAQGVVSERGERAGRRCPRGSVQRTPA